MNKVILMGRLTRDPEVRYSAGENATADFINCVSFGKTAEFAERYFHKGIRITVCGRIQTGSYTNREGQKVYTTEVVVEEQEFAESRAANQQYMAENVPQMQQPAEMPTPSAASADGFMNIPDGIDEELPFS